MFWEHNVYSYLLASSPAREGWFLRLKGQAHECWRTGNRLCTIFRDGGLDRGLEVLGSQSAPPIGQAFWGPQSAPCSSWNSLSRALGDA